jgi:hypothetical protein
MIGADGGSGPSDGGNSRPDVGIPDSPLTLDAVGGVLTYTAFDGSETHIYSAEADGSGRRRVTMNAGNWAYHAVGPDARYVAAIRYLGADESGRPDLDSEGEVWIIDVRAQRTWPISPAGCDAGRGGLSWNSEAMVLFAMSCDGEPSAAYLAVFTDESRNRDNLLQVSNHPQPVRDVFAAVNTSVYAYVLDKERCVGEACVIKPQIWIADVETDIRCQVTDADRDFVGVEEVTGDQNRVGDHAPAFTANIEGLTFTRNVRGKAPGPEGHHDIFRVGLNLRSFFEGDIRCEQPSTEVNLSEDLLDENYGDDGSMPVISHERFIQAAIGERAPAGALLFVGRGYGPEGDRSTAFNVEIDGSAIPLTHPSEWVIYARWIAGDLMLTGER